jgi:hypothetical protein
MLDEGLSDSSFPLLGVVGNHDVLKWYTPNGYKERLESRLHRGSMKKDYECSGEYGVNMVCVWKKNMVHFLFCISVHLFLFGHAVLIFYFLGVCSIWCGDPWHKSFRIH